MKNNWLKMYDKFGLVLRIETVINSPKDPAIAVGFDASLSLVVDGPRSQTSATISFSTHTEGCIAIVRGHRPRLQFRSMHTEIG